MDDNTRLHRASTIGLYVFSLFAFALVLIGLLFPALTNAHVPEPERDEGTLAHLFQLSIVALAPIGLVFLATADWTRPWRYIRQLLVPGVAVILAFSILYYFEKYLPAHP